jgi:hypothetical protein
MTKRHLRYVALSAIVLIAASDVRAAMQTDPSKTTYGARNPDAPKELEVFAFLIGKWEGTGRARLANGTFAESPYTWIGRYVLDGTAIADEGHTVAPDGKPYLGISLRQYDASRKTWIVEFVNVTNSFVRKQVNGVSGAVTVDGRTVTVSSESPEMSIREHYLVAVRDHWVYRMDVSTDGGRTWNDTQVEMSFHRVE